MQAHGFRQQVQQPSAIFRSNLALGGAEVNADDSTQRYYYYYYYYYYCY